MNPTLDYASPPPRGGYTRVTLQYTGASLFILILWLLWGSFVWTLCDAEIPSLIALRLHDAGASNTISSILNKGLAYALVFLVVPIISFLSDCHRSARGRRMPFLIWSTPFIGLFLVLVGCHEDLARLFFGDAAKVLFANRFLGTITTSSAILVLASVGYDLANLFTNTLFWYLFNDVVPENWLGRFFACFRCVGVLAAFIFSKWIFPNTLDHFRLVFVAAGICFVVGFLLMCFMVKEGRYPPPPRKMIEHVPLVSGFVTYIVECFTSPFLWCFFLMNTFLMISWQASMYSMVRNRYALGLSLEEMGNMEAATTMVGVALPLTFLAGWLVDYIHPLRVFVIASILALLSPLAQCIFIFTDFGPHGNLIAMFIISFSCLPFSMVQSAAELPMYMRVLPQQRYGQLCSANAMVRALALAISAPLMTLFLSSLEYLGDWRYRLYPVWTLFFQLIAVVFMLLLYRQWNRGTHFTDRFMQSTAPPPPALP